MDCTGAYLAFGQLVTIYICQHIIVLLYMLYFDHEYEHRNEQEIGSGYSMARAWCWAQLLIEVLFVTLWAIFAYYVGLDSDALYYFGLVNMGCTSFFGILQTVPQILETWKLQQLGSLSIPTVVIQAGGALLTALNLSNHGSWAIWVPYIVISFTQFVLTFEGAYIWSRNRKLKKELLIADATIQDSTTTITPTTPFSPTEIHDNASPF